jgi:hypothetical protein
MTTQSTPESQDTARNIVQSTGVARRRMLLASLGKGSAVIAAAAVPMQSLAAIGTLANTADGKRCTVSGHMSAAHSTQNNLPTCMGWSPGYYKTESHWPQYNSSSNPRASNPINGGTGSFNMDTPFNTLFGGGSIDGLLTCLVATSGHQEEFHWTAALLNGTIGSPAQNYPYTAQQVIDLYKAGGTVRSNAYAFLKDYMETHT